MPQAFKGSLSAMEAAHAMADGVRLAMPRARALASPMADGGDNTLDVLVEAMGGRRFTAKAHDALGRLIEAQWGAIPSRRGGEVAVIEMACASGLRLLKPEEYNPQVASTFGTGELIRAALDAGYSRIIVGIGGSATVDGGSGAARALGVRFLDASGRELPQGGAALADLASIDMAGLDPRVRTARITVACDVDIPVLGPRGAWAFSFQKGATLEVANALNVALEHYCAIVKRDLGLDLTKDGRAGPAGALAAGLRAFLGARLVRGPELVLRITGATARLPRASLIITGEGSLDRQSFEGKGTSVLAQLGRDAGVPVIAVVGQVGANLPDMRASGIVAVETLVAHTASPEDARRRARELIVTATASAVAKHLGKVAPGL